MRSIFKGLCLVLGLCLCAVVVGCGDSDPIKVGYVGPLSGTLSDYGLSCRRGVVLAVEELNAAGGVKGRKIELLIEDDKNDPDIAAKVDSKLVDKGVVTIIGHFTSTAGVGAAPVMNEKKMLLISPGASTSRLSGKDDFFLRTIESDDEKARSLAKYAYTTLGKKRAALVYDTANRAYSEGFGNSFKEAFEKLGGSTAAVIAFDSKVHSLGGKLDPLFESDSDVVFVVAGAADTAVLAQEMEQKGLKLPIISSSWAMRKEFIQNAGAAGENILFSRSLNINSDNPKMKDFRRKFEQRFGESPDGAAARGYDSVMALKIGLENASELTSESIRQAILEHKTIPALSGDFQLDKYGDALRDSFIFVVKDGSFQPLD